MELDQGIVIVDGSDACVVSDLNLWQTSKRVAVCTRTAGGRIGITRVTAVSRVSKNDLEVFIRLDIGVAIDDDVNFGCQLTCQYCHGATVGNVVTTGSCGVVHGHPINRDVLIGHLVD